MKYIDIPLTRSELGVIRERFQCILAKYLKGTVGNWLDELVDWWLVSSCVMGSCVTTALARFVELAEGDLRLLRGLSLGEVLCRFSEF